MTDPFLDEVTLRAWGTDDPRTLHDLRHENDPGGRGRRTKAVRRRALDAGYPVPTVLASNRAATRALEQLEQAPYVWNGTRHNDWLFRPRHNENVTPAEECATEDGLVTIFDE